ncbi:cytochrome P450 [Colletotrichum tofieldiae]|uniref:Cytochrome P450 n=1 Tax=Colletotrichum tofieldiae TaxID=708197 RepID=A0A166S2D2_9PEZI|nr:cytochrome P450 [Colletotrichum tofieldiae]GKT80908.1 cytochrome P450 [Colletotrichum tofieldiae]
MKIIARVTSLIFVGPELCRDPAWLDITVAYFAKSNAALKELRRYPPLLRSLVNRFAPKNRELRNMVARARRLIDPVISSRRESTRLAIKSGTPVSRYHDALSWGEQLAMKRSIRYDAAALQLALSLTAMHTSGDFIAQLLVDLCQHRHLLRPLREEMREILGSGSWEKATTLNNLKLLDSVLKESQRLKPVSIISMGRVARNNVVLKNEILIPKNSIVAISCHFMWDPTKFENPLTFDGYRFLKRRTCGDTNKEHTATLVTTSPDHMGFGHGTYACPGRFFGVNEVKIILCHFLLRFDFKLADGTLTQPVRWGFEILANPAARLRVRRRIDDLDL